MIPISFQLQVLFCVVTTTIANHNIDMTSQVVYGDTRIRGFRDATNKDFVLGGLFPVHSGTDCKKLRQQRGLERLETMLFAIDRINSDPNLLPNLTIGYDVRDTCSEETIGIDEALDMIVRSGSLTIDTSMEYVQVGNLSTRMSGIVGAAASSVSTPTATLLGLRLFQSPIVSYASSSAALSNKNLYEYFLRTIPPDGFQANAMVALVRHFGWEYVSVIFNDNIYGGPGTDAFISGAMEHDICIDYRKGIIQSEISGPEVFRETISETVSELLNSTASVVVAFTDEATIMALFEELRQRNSMREFVWIASDAWANSHIIRDNFLDIAEGTFGFQPHAHMEHVEEFHEYFSQLTPSTNLRDPFFPEYHAAYCNENGTDCPDGSVTSNPSYSQGNNVPLIIDAVYVFAHALQNFLANNCDSRLRWDRATQSCDGMKNDLNGENLLGYIFNVSFNGIQNRSVSFDENGDPHSGVFEIVHLQVDENETGEYVSAGIWDSLGDLQLNNNIQFEKIYSQCSEPCNDGMIRRITNPSCPSCFECIPCIGPTYSMNSSSNECNMCPNDHWGNSPLSGSTHCVPIKVRHLDFSSGLSIVSICMASIALLILAVVTVIFVVYWNTPVVKSTDREQMVMLLVAIGISCTLTYIAVAPPSTIVCVFQRIGVWFCFSLAFGALLVKIVHIARIFYSIKHSLDSPSFSNCKYQVMFTMAIVFFQLILVVIGLIVDHPVVKRDPEVVVTGTAQQTGNAPEIIETCQQSHTAILVISLVYNTVLIVGCTILGWMTRKFPDNFNEAENVMFTSFTLMVVWVLFVPLYLYTEHEYQIGVIALGIVLSAIALMAGVFFPRVYVLVFQKHKNTTEYVKQQSHLYIIRSTNQLPFQQRNSTSGEGTHDQDSKVNTTDSNKNETNQNVTMTQEIHY